MDSYRDEKGRYKQGHNGGPGRGNTAEAVLNDNDFFAEVDKLLKKSQKSKDEAMSLRAIQLRMKLKEMQDKFNPTKFEPVDTVKLKPMQSYVKLYFTIGAEGMEEFIKCCRTCDKLKKYWSE